MNKKQPILLLRNCNNCLSRHLFEQQIFHLKLSIRTNTFCLMVSNFNSASESRSQLLKVTIFTAINNQLGGYQNVTNPSPGHIYLSCLNGLFILPSAIKASDSCSKWSRCGDKLTIIYFYASLPFVIFQEP